MKVLVAAAIALIVLLSGGSVPVSQQVLTADAVRTLTDSKLNLTYVDEHKETFVATYVRSDSSKTSRDGEFTRQSASIPGTFHHYRYIQKIVTPSPTTLALEADAKASLEARGLPKDHVNATCAATEARYVDSGEHGTTHEGEFSVWSVSDPSLFHHFTCAK